MDCGCGFLIKLRGLMWIKISRSTHFCWLDTTWEQHWRSSPVPMLSPSSTQTERMLSGQSTKTNKAASDATIVARVGKSFACVGWRGVALSPTGHQLAVYLGPFRRHQSNDCFEIIIAVLHCRTACWPTMRGFVLVLMFLWAGFVLGTAIIARSPIPPSISRYRLIDMNRTVHASCNKKTIDSKMFHLLKVQYIEQLLTYRWAQGLAYQMAQRPAGKECWSNAVVPATGEQFCQHARHGSRCHRG